VRPLSHHPGHHASWRVRPDVRERHLLPAGDRHGRRDVKETVTARSKAVTRCAGRTWCASAGASAEIRRLLSRHRFAPGT